jgi:hypothetical protein
MGFLGASKSDELMSDRRCLCLHEVGIMYFVSLGIYVLSIIASVLFIAVTVSHPNLHVCD